MECLKPWFTGGHSVPKKIRPSPSICFSKWLWLLSLVSLPVLAKTARGVIEGDMGTYGYVELYINSVYVRADGLAPALFMNSIRRFETLTAVADAIYMKDPLQPGNVVGLKVYSDLPSTIAISDPMGNVMLYKGWSAVIGSFDDGTITNSQWKCMAHANFGGAVTQTMVTNGRWHASDYDDSAWPAAFEQPDNCCPWRDNVKMWGRFKSRWISPPASANVNNSVPREFFCRYTLPNTASLMDGSLVRASTAAPALSMISLIFSQHVAAIRFNVSRTAEVTCGLIDARFLLRPPSPFELKSWGVTARKSPTEQVWVDQTGANSQKQYLTAALAWHNVLNINACQVQCDQLTGCNALTYYETGIDPLTLGNCKLMSQLITADINNTISNFRFFHMVRQTQLAKPEIFVAGLLQPGTLYYSYCMANDTTQNLHSTWFNLASTRQDARTTGCFDCGKKPPPTPRLLGGFAGRNKIIVLVKTDSPGRVFCAARDISMYGIAGGGTPLTITQVRAAGFFNLVFVGGNSVPIEISSLQNNTLYEVSCLAETEGGQPSTVQSLNQSRRKWSTEAKDPIIQSLTLTEQAIANQGVLQLTIVTAIRVTSQGFLWCQVYNTSDVNTSDVNHRVPSALTLEHTGLREKISYASQDGAGIFTGLNVNKTYETYCTGRYDDFSNVSGQAGLQSPLWIDSGKQEVLTDQVILTMAVRAPSRTSRVYCRAFRWSTRPYTVRPSLPSFATMRQTPPSIKLDINIVGGANVRITISDLTPGSMYDVYCFVEEQQGPVPPGAQPPALASMNLAALLATRQTFQTLGPEFRDQGWHCIAGHYCGITNVRGRGLSPNDGLIVRASWCRGRCQCSGQEDITRKGASCSAVSHNVNIHNPSPGGAIDASDPNGEWCYVQPGLCQDEQASPTFPSMKISYKVCAMKKSVSLPGAGPIGFPNEGVARKLSADGTAFDWGAAPLFTLGAAYNLCWCNSTISSCLTEYDFSLRIGVLFMSGPTLAQNMSTSVCIANRPCAINFFAGEAVANGNRLAVLPNTNQGCFWQRNTIADPYGVVGFPNMGMSEPATGNGFRYSWGAQPVLANGGTYLLCWCGTLSANNTPMCPARRPDDGLGFWSGAGYLRIVGPDVGAQLACNVGFVCTLSGVQGTGLQGGDRMAVLQSCGQPVPQTLNWTMGVAGSTVPMRVGWLDGGWLRYDPRTANNLQRQYGSPPSNASLLRGAWGMPYAGISLNDSRIGYFTWGAPSVAWPGTYVLCWCPSGSQCDAPAFFKVLMGTLNIYGPHVLPAASQAFTCVRNRQCEVNGLDGTWEPGGSILMIADGPCGSQAPNGFPRNGISTSSATNSRFSWGPEAIVAPPGKYRLCWCRGACLVATQYLAFAGILRVKGAVGDFTRQWICGLNQSCMVNGIQGESLNSGDQVAAMTVCGTPGFSGNFKTTKSISVETAPDGSWFRLPPVQVSGVYRICWCAAETLCVTGSEFDLDLGALLVGGSNGGPIYVCYEWKPCSIVGLLGTFLSNGDRLRVVPRNTSCIDAQGNPKPSSALPTIAGFPQNGVGSPATRGGLDHSWGPDRVRASPGIYSLCWCSGTLAPGGVCGVDGPFKLDAGSIRIGTLSEYTFLNRSPGPSPRSSDALYPILLAIVPAIVLALVAVLGWRRLTMGGSRKKMMDVMTVNPFAMPKSWMEKDQEKSKLEYAVKNVRTLRILALGELPDTGMFGDTDTAVDVFKHQQSPNSHSGWAANEHAVGRTEQQAAIMDNQKGPPGWKAVMNSLQESFTLPGRPQTETALASKSSLRENGRSMSDVKAWTIQPPTGQREPEDEDDDIPPLPELDAPRMPVNARLREILELPPVTFETHSRRS